MSAALLIFFVIDIIALGTLQNGISIFDVGSGLFDPSVVKITWSIVGSILLVGFGILLTFVFTQTPFFKKRQKKYTLWSILIFLIVWWMTAIIYQAHIPFPDNILSSNRNAISGFFRDRFGTPWGNAQTYLSSFASIKADKKRPNVIVVFAESLSRIDSQKMGGANNLPYFDKIQADGMSFPNFLANGCTSDTAHIALLQWVEPRKFTWQEWNTYSGYNIPTSPLAQFFTEEWYRTFFLSTASLSFLDQRSFLSGVGFSTIIGEEAFDIQDKYVFDAAPDQILYKKALTLMQQQKDNYFLALQTISFHRPYNTPYGDDEMDALRYADKSLYYFYQQLKKSWFFDNGLLIIVWDHRKMESMVEWEKDRFGPLRYATALATVVGTGITPGSSNTHIIQHTDIFYSLKKLIGQSNVTVSKFFNDIFSPKKWRDRWVVFCRYFTNRYGVRTSTNSWAWFEYVGEIKSLYPTVYGYIQSYSSYQNPLSSGNIKIGDDDRIALIAHRGILNEVTENSLEWFLLAKKYGANGIEMDISQTKDQQNIVLHGESLYPTICGNNKKVSHYTLAWLQQNCPLTNKETIRTFEEMLTALSGMFDYYFVELKVYNNNGVQQALDAIATVKKLWMEDRVIFTSYDKAVTYLLWATEWIHAWRDTFDMQEVNLIPNFRHEYFLAPLQNITGSLIPTITTLGKKMVVYVVNTRDELEKLYHQWVRIIMTDNLISMKEYADKLTLGQ